MKILVTDGDSRPALAVVRALGRRGDSVIVAEDHPASLAGRSKYCADHIVYPSPHTNGPAFDEFLLDLVSRGDFDVVMPVTDVTTHLICRQQDALRRFTALAVPSFGSFDRVTNKWTLIESARRRGIPVPPTELVDGRNELGRALDRIEYPVVVKPVRSRIPTSRGWLAAGVDYARSEAELRALYRDRSHLAVYPSLIQQRIVGPGLGVFGLFDRGRLVADFAHRRLREKPPSGGTSVLRESVPVDPALRRQAIGLLGSIGWHGVAMMEYKQDLRTGEKYLIEVNGRFWGSLQLAIDAGVDFPVLCCELARGRRLATRQDYRVGVRSRWLLGDLDHLLLRLLKKDRDLDLPPDAPSKWRACADFLKFAQSDLHYEVASTDDPRPFLHEFLGYTRALTASAARWVRRRIERNSTETPQRAACPEPQNRSRRVAG